MNQKIPPVLESPFDQPDTPPSGHGTTLDLRTLAPTRSGRPLVSSNGTSASRDLFDLLGLTFATAEMQPASNSLAEVLPRAPSQAGVPGAEAMRPTACDEGDCLHQLHEEFVRVLRDPSELAAGTCWLGSADAGRPTNEVHSNASPYTSLRETVLPALSLAQVIESWGSAEHSPALLEPQAPEDVLHLFAGELAEGGRHRLPGLTLREHHALSPDSHVHMSQTTLIAQSEAHEPT